MRHSKWWVGGAFAVGSLVGAVVALQQFEPAHAAGGKAETNGIAQDRYVYYPGTEELKPDEIRMIACGTGMPAARRDQAATCWLVELGNGDKFLFDLGTGSMANIAALMIPYDYLDKVFLSHLHTDHWGDLAGLWAGGWTSGRTKALGIWGPAGKTPEMGTKYAVEHFIKAYNWDYQTRMANLPHAPGQIDVHEFDYMAENAVIYEENGCVIRTWPAIHAGDGAVSMSLEWNGLKIVIGGDTKPNKWYIEHATDADVAIHEAFMLPEQLVKYYGQAPAVALGVGTQVHTSPQAFGKVMSTIKPRHAIAYHFFNESGTRAEIDAGIRQTYDGPLTLAQDNLVWNITKDAIREREVVSPGRAWSVPGTEPVPRRKGPADRSVFSKEVLAGVWDVSDAEGAMKATFRKKYGLPEPEKE